MPETVNMFVRTPASTRDTGSGFRSFKVEHPDFIELPGNLTVTEVRLGGHDIPQSITEQVMVDTTRKNFKDVQIKLWDVADDGAGPILIRSQKSNDGKWQVGQIVQVKGTWSDDAAAAESPAPEAAAPQPPADGLDALTVADLTAKAAEANIDLGGATKKADILAVIRKALAAAS